MLISKGQKPRRDRPVRTLVSTSGQERAPHESAIYLFSFAFAHARSHLDIRRSLDDREVNFEYDELGAASE